MSRILLVQAHPDTAARHLGHALADAYSEGARSAGHEVRLLEIAKLDFPLLRSQYAWEHEPVPPALAPAQQDIAWAEHLVFFYPLWLGDMPALLKAFLEQVARPGFAFSKDASNPFSAQGLKGRSARLVVTMGMPAFVYRWYFAAHSVRAFRRNILQFVGIKPVRATVLGAVGDLAPEKAQAWLTQMRRIGAAAR